MNRTAGFSSPFMLGFEELERVFDRATKTAGDGYPPYNIERISPNNGEPERLRITLALAGFSKDQLDVEVEDGRLSISGKQHDEPDRHYLHKGIAARQFQRTFVLAESMEVSSANLTNGLLEVDLVRLEPERLVRKISIKTASKSHTE